MDKIDKCSIYCKYLVVEIWRDETLYCCQISCLMTALLQPQKDSVSTQGTPSHNKLYTSNKQYKILEIIKKKASMPFFTVSQHIKIKVSYVPSY